MTAVSAPAVDCYWCQQPAAVCNICRHHRPESFRDGARQVTRRKIAGTLAPVTASCARTLVAAY